MLNKILNFLDEYYKCNNIISKQLIIYTNLYYRILKKKYKSYFRNYFLIKDRTRKIINHNCKLLFQFEQNKVYNLNDILEINMKKFKDDFYIILWSGGVDSTFIISVFLLFGYKNFKIITYNEAKETQFLLYERLKKEKLILENFNIFKLKNNIKIITGINGDLIYNNHEYDKEIEIDNDLKEKFEIILDVKIKSFNEFFSVFNNIFLSEYMNILLLNYGLIENINHFSFFNPNTFYNFFIEKTFYSKEKYYKEEFQEFIIKNLKEYKIFNRKFYSFKENDIKPFYFISLIKKFKELNKNARIFY